MSVKNLGQSSGIETARLKAFTHVRGSKREKAAQISRSATLACSHLCTYVLEPRVYNRKTMWYQGELLVTAYENNHREADFGTLVNSMHIINCDSSKRTGNEDSVNLARSMEVCMPVTLAIICLSKQRGEGNTIKERCMRHFGEALVFQLLIFKKVSRFSDAASVRAVFAAGDITEVKVLHCGH